MLAGARYNDLEQQALRELPGVRQVEGRLCDTASSTLVRAILHRAQPDHQAGAVH